MQDFMKGRYGVDELTLTLGGLGVVLALIGAIANLRVISIIALIVLVLAVLRALSKDAAARRRENDAFRSFAQKVPGLSSLAASLSGAGRGGNGAAAASRRAQAERTKRVAQRMWTDRKTTKFLRCPSCGQMLSVPKGKGRIRVTCPRCGTKTETKS